MFLRCCCRTAVRAVSTVVATVVATIAAVVTTVSAVDATAAAVVATVVPVDTTVSAAVTNVAAVAVLSVAAGSCRMSQCVAGFRCVIICCRLCRGVRCSTLLTYVAYVYVC